MLPTAHVFTFCLFITIFIPSAARIPPGRLRNRRWLSNSGYVWLSILTAIFSKSGVSWGLALIWYFLLILVRDFYALVVKFGEIWGHFSPIFGRFWDPNRQFLMLVGKVGVQVGSSAKIERNWGPIFQKKLLLGGHVWSFFWSFFGRSFERAFLATVGPKGSQKEAPGVTFEGQFWSFFGSLWKIENWALAAEWAQNLRFQGFPNGICLGLFFSSVLGPPQEASQINFFRIYVNFGGHLGSIFLVIFGSFFKVKKIWIFCTFGTRNEPPILLPRGPQRPT